jgi:hypothetical protein
MRGNATPLPLPAPTEAGTVVVVEDTMVPPIGVPPVAALKVTPPTRLGFTAAARPLAAPLFTVKPVIVLRVSVDVV